MIHAMIRMNVENMLSESSQPQKVTCITYQEQTNQKKKKDKSLESKSELVFSRNWKQQGVEFAKDTGVIQGMMKMF